MAKSQINFLASAEISQQSVKGRFQTRKDVWRGIEMHIANTDNGLVGMDFAGYGDFAAFLHIRDAFSSSAAAILRERRRR